MNVRSRMIGVACLAGAVGAMAAAGPALAASVGVQAPPSAKANTDVTVVYSGQVDPGPAGVGTLLNVFYELNAPNCAPTTAAQRGRANSKFDGQQYVGANPGPTPFSFDSTLNFSAEGTYRICAYLDPPPGDGAAPPAATSEAVVKVGAPSTPCLVPRVIGMTLKAATARLKAAGCTTGTVTGVKKSRKKIPVVRSQSVAADLTVESGAKINLVMRFKKR